MTPAGGSQAPLPPDAAVPQLLVSAVMVPDYLDSTDILVRRGAGELLPSRTGRWGERLSSAIRDTLLADLRGLLPAGTLSETHSCDAASHFLSVRVIAFDVHRDGGTVLLASWTMRAGRAGAVLAADDGTFTVLPAIPGKPVTDATLVAAMTQALDELAGRLAAIALQPIPEQSPSSSGRTPPC